MIASISWYKDLAQLTQGIIVSGGILVSGWWTWRLFIRKRLAYPRLGLDLLISPLSDVGDGRRLVHVEVLVKNTGDVLFRAADGTTLGCPNGSYHYAELRLRRVLPVHGDVADIGGADCESTRKGGAEIEWPLLDRKEWCVKKHPFELEPGESDPLHADFMVPANVSVVQFYFFLRNPQKKDIGWTCTKFFSFKDSMEATEMVEKNDSGKSRLEEQQRQQKQQQQQQQQSQQVDPAKKKES